MSMSEGYVYVLIVDDHPPTRRLHQLAFCEAAAETGQSPLFKFANTITEAKNWMGQKDFDLVVLDGNLPDGTFKDFFIPGKKYGSKMKVHVVSNSSESVLQANQHENVSSAHQKPFNHFETVELFKGFLNNLIPQGTV